MQRAADRRAELDLQISLLTEHELTQAVRLIDHIAQRLDVPRPKEEDLAEIKKDVDPEHVVKQIDLAEAKMGTDAS
jgi:uncharacterized membrane protein